MPAAVKPIAYETRERRCQGECLVEKAWPNEGPLRSARDPSSLLVSRLTSVFTPECAF
jgi:hypothetical protein